MSTCVRKRMMRWPGILLCGIPLIYYLFTLLFYVSVSLSLGQWADTMGADDPKAFFAGIPHFLSIMLMILSFAIVPLVVLDGLRKKRVVLYLLLYLMCLTLCICLFRLVTPWLGSWIMD